MKTTTGANEDNRGRLKTTAGAIPRAQIRHKSGQHGQKPKQQETQLHFPQALCIKPQVSKPIWKFQFASRAGFGFALLRKCLFRSRRVSHHIINCVWAFFLPPLAFRCWVCSRSLPDCDCNNSVIGCHKLLLKEGCIGSTQNLGVCLLEVACGQRFGRALSRHGCNGLAHQHTCWEVVSLHAED